MLLLTDTVNVSSRPPHMMSSELYRCCFYLLFLLVSFLEGLSYKNSFVVRIWPQPDVSRLDVIINMRDTYETADKPQIRFIEDILLPRINLTFVLPPDVRQEVLTYLNDNHVEYEIKDTNLESTLKSLDALNAEARDTWRQKMQSDQIIFPEYYLTYDEIMAWLKDVVNRYNGVASWKVIGQTHEGRDLVVVEIQNNDVTDKDLISIFISSGLDSSNWLAPASSLYLIAQILSDSHLRDGLRWTIAPLSNPDGYVYSMEQDRLWTKNRQPYGDCIGTDLTKNWAHLFGFQAARQESCHRLHHGPEAFSEQETRALRDAILADSDVDVYLNIEGTPGAWLLPWSGKTFLKTDDYEDLLDVAVAVTTAVNVEGDVRFVNGTPPDLRRPASGAAMDWVKEYTKIKYAYTVDLVHASDSSAITFLQAPSKIKQNGRWLLTATEAAISSIRHFRSTSEWQYVTWGGLLKDEHLSTSTQKEDNTISINDKSEL